MAPAASIRNTSLLVGGIAVLSRRGAGCADREVADPPDRAVNRSRAGGGRYKKITIPVEARGETGVLARAFAQAIERSECKDCRAPARGTGASPHRSGARPSCRAGAAVQRGGIILQRRHHHHVARRHLTGWNSAAERCSDTARRKPGREHHADCTRRSAAGVAGRAAPDRLGESIEPVKRSGREKVGGGSKSRSASPDQVPLRRDHRHLEGGARHHRSQQDQTGAAAPGRRATPDQRMLAGSDHGGGCQRISGSGSARAARPSWATGRRK